MSQNEGLILKEDVRRLKDQVDQLFRIVESHQKHEYLIAQQVFSSLLFYRSHYASSEGYQKHFQDILSMLRTLGKHTDGRSPDAKFMMGLADLLEESNKGGEWPGLHKE
jgi:hypothetical protein